MAFSSAQGKVIGSMSHSWEGAGGGGALILAVESAGLIDRKP